MIIQIISEVIEILHSIVEADSTPNLEVKINDSIISSRSGARQNYTFFTET